MKLFRTIGILGTLGVASLPAICVHAQQDQAQQNPAQQNPAQQNPAQQNQAGLAAQGGFDGGIQRAPWFRNQQIQKQLQLNEEQYRRLNQSYMRSWEQYNKGLSGLDGNLNEQQRMQRLQEMNGLFHKDFSKSVDEVFADRAARQRYNQMEWQYRGYGAFNDPTLQQQLNLEQEQRQKLARYQREWNDQLRTWRREYAKNGDGVNNRFREAYREQQERINAILTPQQRKMWTDLRGKPFEIPTDVYFEGDTDTDTNSDTAPIK